MAMTLTKTRLRMTQAIYFGVPPVVGGSGTVTSITAGTGVTLTPSPITGAGSVALTVPVAVTSGGTGATALTGIISGNGFLPLTGNTLVNLTNQVSGTLPPTSGGTGSTGLTAGSIPYIGPAGVFAQDPGNIFWDSTNHRLGLGTNSPSYKLHLVDNSSVTAAWIVGNTTTGRVLDVQGADRTWSLVQGGTQSSAGGFGIRDQFNSVTRLAIDGSGNVGVGTTSPTSPLTVNGTIEIKAGSAGVLKFQDGTTQASAAAGGGTVNGTGTATNIAFWTAGSTISSDNALFWDNTNKRAGIGTSVPNAPLELRGDAGSPQSGIWVTTAAYTNSVSGTVLQIGQGANTGNTYSQINSFQTGGTFGGPLALQAAGGGAVGIGTIAPGAGVLLDVAGKIAAKDTLRLNGSTSGYVGLKAPAVSPTLTWTWPSADSTGVQYLSSDGAGNLSFATPAGAGTVTTNGALSTGMATFIDPSGATVITGSNNFFWDNVNSRLGVKTSSPLTPLHVGGGAAAPTLTTQILADVAGPAYITAKDAVDVTEFACGADAGGGLVSTQTNSNILFKTNNSLVMTLTNSQYVGVQNRLGIGTTSPAVALHVGGAANPTLYVNTATGKVNNVCYPQIIPDGKANNASNITSGSQTLALVGGGDTFSASDVGKTILVQGAGAFGALLTTTISGYTNSSTVTLALAASTTAVSAKATWGTDATTAIQNAISNAVISGWSSGVVQFWPGRYIVNGMIQVPSNGGGITLAGAGKGQTIISQLSPGTETFRFTSSSANQIVRDMQIEGPGSGFCTGFSSAVSWAGTGAPYFGSAVKDCTIRDFAYGVVINTSAGGSGPLIENCQILAVSNTGIYNNSNFLGYVLINDLIYTETLVLPNLTMNGGSAVVTAASPVFSSGLIGYRIVVPNAGPAGGDLVALISSVQSTTQATLTLTATGGVVAVAGGMLQSAMQYGINMSGGSLECASLNIVGGVSSVYINPPTGYSSNFLYFTWCAFDSASDIGVWIAPTGLGQCNSAVFSNCWFASAGAFPGSTKGGGTNQMGLFIGGDAANSTNSIQFNACRFVNNFRYGAYLYRGTNVDFTGCTFDGNSARTSGGYEALYATGFMSDIGISANRFGHQYFNQGTTDLYSVTLGFGISGTLMVANNSFRNFSVAATPVNDGTVMAGTAKFIGNNVYA